MYRLLLLNLLLNTALFSHTYASDIAASPPENYLYTQAGELDTLMPLLARPDIAGVQVVYNWKMLEKEQGKYDFSLIEQDLQRVNTVNKKLFIQIQDRFFEPHARHVPAYLLTDPVYHGGIVPQYDNPGEGLPIGSGWVAQQWTPAVQTRYQQLLRALAARFDGRVYGVNLPETAIDIDRANDQTGFSCDKYFTAEIENMGVVRQAFRQSHVVQYVNFWPCEWNNDHRYMSRLFAYAAEQGIGLGGPDIIPNKPGQMKNAYPFFNQYKGKLSLVAMAVQEPTLTYINPKTHQPFTKAEFQDYGQHYLGTQIIFWSPSSPWLHSSRVTDGDEPIGQPSADQR